VIGRDGPVKPFELIRWARQQARQHDLKLLDAHVLLVLATYANADCIAWPSLRTLALDSGLQPTPDGRNSAVSAAIARLEDLRLVWSKQAGHGHPAKRELLFKPEALPAQPSAVPEGSTVEASGPAFRPDGQQPSGLTEEKDQRNGQERTPRTSTSERPDDAFRSRGRQSPFQQEDQDENTGDQVSEVELLTAYLVRRHPEYTAEEIRGQVARQQRAGSDPYLALVELARSDANGGSHQ